MNTKINKVNSPIYNGKYFEDIIFNIFRSISNIDIQKEPKIEGYKYIPDLLITIKNTRYIAEIKYYRSENIPLNLIHTAISKLYSIENYEKILIIPNFSRPETRTFIEEYYKNLVLIDGYDLLRLTEDDIKQKDKLKSILPMDYFNKNYFNTYHNKFISKIIPKYKDYIEHKKDSEKLIENINELQPGKENSRKYEKLCVKIINFLLEDSILTYKEQQVTDDGLLRPDLICRINPTNEFWDFIVKEINSRYVIFEFKNYSDEIDQREILTSERYLFNKALRKVAIIFSRKGGNNSADKFRRGALRENGKVILILNDDDVKEMIKMKENGSDPTNLLFEKMDELFMTINR